MTNGGDGGRGTNHEGIIVVLSCLLPKKIVIVAHSTPLRLIGGNFSFVLRLICITFLE